MFDKFTRKLAEKMGQSVKEVAQPIKEEVSQKVNNRVDLYSKVLRLGVLVFLFIEGTKKATNSSNHENSNAPNQIIINNYLNTPEKSRKEGDQDGI